MADGSLWVGTWFKGVFWRDAGGNWHAYTGADGLGGNTVRAIAAAPDGSIWFGTESGLSRLRADGQWQRFGQADGLPEGGIGGLHVFADGSLLLASGDSVEGVSLMRPDGTWQTLLPPRAAVPCALPSRLMKRSGSARRRMGWCVWAWMGRFEPAHAVMGHRVHQSRRPRRSRNSAAACSRCSGV